MQRQTENDLQNCLVKREEHKLDCLARWMLDKWETEAERQLSLIRIENKHGAAFASDIKARIMREHNKRKNK